MKVDILEILAGDKELVTYRPALRGIGSSVIGTIILQQIIYWWKRSGGKFYKFIEPCDHAMYKQGDSWSEELGLSAKEFRTGLENFAFKCGKKNKELHGEGYEEAKNSHTVWYYTDNDRVTWYQINESLLHKLLSGVYEVTPQAAVTYPTVSETTTENTSDHLKSPQHWPDKGTPKGNLPTPTPVPTPPSPLPFPSPEFAKAWESWETYRKETKKKITPTTRKAQFAKFIRWGEKKSIDSINRSIENGWQGLFEPQENTVKNYGGSTPWNGERKNYGW